MCNRDLLTYRTNDINIILPLIRTNRELRNTLAEHRNETLLSPTSTDVRIKISLRTGWFLVGGPT